MKEVPRITVIMGIYNCASTLVEALESLEAQTYKRFKVILQVLENSKAGET